MQDFVVNSLKRITNNSNAFNSWKYFVICRDDGRKCLENIREFTNQYNIVFCISLLTTGIGGCLARIRNIRMFIEIRWRIQNNLGKE